MATIDEVCDALAELLKVSLDTTYAVGTYPTTPQASSVIVVPSSSTDFATFDGGTFCRPMYALSAWLVASSTNPPAAMKWLFQRIALASTAVNSDPTLSGRVSNLMVEAVGPPGRISETQSNPLMAVELRFRPFFLSE